MTQTEKIRILKNEVRRLRKYEPKIISQKRNNTRVGGKVRGVFISK